MKWTRLFRGVASRFTTLVAIGLASLSLVVADAYFGFSELSGSIQSLVDHRIPITATLGEMRTQINGIGRDLLAASIDTDRDSKNKRLDRVLQRMDTLTNEVNSLLKQPLKAENKERALKVQEIWTNDKSNLKNLVEAVRSSEPDKHKADALMMITVSQGFNDILIEMGKVNEKINDSIKAESLASIRKNNTLLFSISAIAYLLLISLGTFMAVRLVKSLSSITANIGNAGTSVRDASNELSSTSQSLANSQTENAASLEETVASVEELSSIVQRNSEQAKIAEKLSVESESIASLGGQEVEKLIGSVQGIAESSKQIDEIITIIDDIAFQTNLLALNAAVEAARAGEQGKGFAVVADAVRALAQRSASAAKDISGLITKSVSQSNEGAKLAVESGEVFQKVIQSIKKVSEINKDIANASQEQAAGLRQISQAMNQLDQSTQANAAAAEQTAATSEELTQQSQSLARLVESLKQVVEGESSSENTSSERAPAKVLPFQENIKKAPKVSASKASKNDFDDVSGF